MNIQSKLDTHEWVHCSPTSNKLTGWQGLPSWIGIGPYYKWSNFEPMQGCPWLRLLHSIQRFWNPHVSHEIALIFNLRSPHVAEKSRCRLSTLGPQTALATSVKDSHAPGKASAVDGEPWSPRREWWRILHGSCYGKISHKWLGICMELFKCHAGSPEATTTYLIPSL